MSAPPATGLATAKEVAEFLRTSENQLSRLRYEGHGPQFIKLGRSVRYRWDDIQAWIADSMQGGGTK